MHISKNIKVTISMLLLLIGAVSFSFSTYLYMKPLKEKEGKEIKAEAIEQCKISSKNHGFAVVQIGNKIDYVKYGLDSWKDDLASLSFIILQCPGLDVEEFCMGSECKDSRNKKLEGVFMRLQYN